MKLRAYNSNGWSAFSELNTVGQLVNTLPLAMTVPTYTWAYVTNTQIKFDWIALTGTQKGGAAVTIDFYEIEWDQGTGNWVSLTAAVDPSLTSYTHSSLSQNTEYKHRIRAINKYGASLSFSPEISILTAQPPDTPDPPQTEIHDIYVKVSWAAPFENYRPITSYTVYIETSISGTFVINS